MKQASIGSNSHLPLKEHFVCPHMFFYAAASPTGEAFVSGNNLTNIQFDHLVCFFHGQSLHSKR